MVVKMQINDDTVAVYDAQQDEKRITENKKVLSKEIRRDLRYALEIQNAEKTAEVISDILGRIDQRSAERKEVVDICLEICYLVSAVVPNGDAIIKRVCNEESAVSYAYYNKNIPSLLQWMVALKNELQEEFGGSDVQSNNIVTWAKEYIGKHLESKFGLEEVAEYLEISPGYLSSIFKKQTGMGFSDYVTMERVVKAQELLSTGTFKIYEVAWKLGFENQYYFSRVFKKTTGKSPSEFVESVRKGNNH